MNWNSDFPIDLQAWSPRIRFVLNLILVIVIGWSLSRLGWLLVEPAGTVSRPVPLQRAVLESGTSRSMLTAADFTVLTGFSRFGRAAAPQSLAPVAPETSLNLVLKGVRAVPTGPDGQPTSIPIAMIATPDGAVKAFHPGDLVLDGVTLETVLSDHVLIMKNGVLESLAMESSAASLAVLSRPGEDGLVQGKRRDPSEPVATSGDTIDRAALASLDISPVVVDGYLTGYQVTTGAASEAFAKAGLHSGDIVTALDGASITDMDPAELMERVGSASSLSLTVDRTGTSHTVNLNISTGETE